jgi:hypothetical protein
MLENACGRRVEPVMAFGGVSSCCSATLEFLAGSECAHEQFHGPWHGIRRRPAAVEHSHAFTTTRIRRPDTRQPQSALHLASPRISRCTMPAEMHWWTAGRHGEASVAIMELDSSAPHHLSLGLVDVPWGAGRSPDIKVPSLCQHRLSSHPTVCVVNNRFGFCSARCPASHRVAVRVRRGSSRR